MGLLRVDGSVGCPTARGWRCPAARRGSPAGRPPTIPVSPGPPCSHVRFPKAACGGPDTVHPTAHQPTARVFRQRVRAARGAGLMSRWRVGSFLTGLTRRPTEADRR